MSVIFDIVIEYSILIKLTLMFKGILYQDKKSLSLSKYWNL